MTLNSKLGLQKVLWYKFEPRLHSCKKLDPRLYNLQQMVSLNFQFRENIHKNFAAKISELNLQ